MTILYCYFTFELVPGFPRLFDRTFVLNGRDVTRIAHRHAVDNAFQLPAPCLAVSGNDHGFTDNGGSFNTIDAPGAVATELLFDNEADFLVRFIPLP